MICKFKFALISVDWIGSIVKKTNEWQYNTLPAFSTVLLYLNL